MKIIYKRIGLCFCACCLLLAGCSNASQEADDAISENVITEEAKEPETEEPAESLPEEENLKPDILKDYEEEDYMEHEITSTYFFKSDGYGYELVLAQEDDEYGIARNKEIKAFVSKLEGNEYRLLQVINNEELDGDLHITTGLYLVDVNFDEKKDLLILNGGYGVQYDLYYTCYLYNGESYELCENFSHIPNPYIDRDRERILGSTRYTAGEHGYRSYVFTEDSYYIEKEVVSRYSPREGGSWDDKDSFVWKYILTEYKIDPASGQDIWGEVVSEETFSEEDGEETLHNKMKEIDWLLAFSRNEGLPREVNGRVRNNRYLFDEKAVRTFRKEEAVYVAFSVKEGQETKEWLLDIEAGTVSYANHKDFLSGAEYPNACIPVSKEQMDTLLTKIEKVQTDQWEENYGDNGDENFVWAFGFEDNQGYVSSQKGSGSQKSGAVCPEGYEELEALFTGIMDDLLLNCNREPDRDAYFEDELVFLGEYPISININDSRYENLTLYGCRRENKKDDSLLFSIGKNLYQVYWNWENHYMTPLEVTCTDLDQNGDVELLVTGLEMAGTGIHVESLCLLEIRSAYKADWDVLDGEEAAGKGAEWLVNRHYHNEEKNSIQFVCGIGEVYEFPLPDWTKDYQYKGVNYGNQIDYDMEAGTVEIRPQVEFENSLPYEGVVFQSKVTYDGRYLGLELISVTQDEE